jgi:hypothetical protein
MESPPEDLPVILANSRGETAFAGWEMLKVEPADTAGLGWPMTRPRRSGTGYAEGPRTTLRHSSAWAP